MSDDTKPIVVGVDGSDAAMSAARWAASFAQKIDAPVELVHGMPRTGSMFTDPASAIHAAVLAEHREHAITILKQAEEELRAAFRGLDVSTLRFDEPVDELLTVRSRTAQMVVLGSDMISPATALLVGSTTLAVGAHSACPVVAWRGDRETVSELPIVLGVDRALTGPAAFEAAFEFASRVGAGIKAVHAWSQFGRPAGVANPLLIDWDGLEAMQWQELLHVVEPWAERYPDVPVTYFVDPEGAGKALIKHTADAQLMVVGSRGRKPLAGALLGSTSLNMLHHCPTPVMLCH